MTIPFNGSGMPKGTGSLQIRGRVWWAIYTDETGRVQQLNTQTEDEAEARHFLALRAVAVLKAKLAAVKAVLDEQAPGKARSARRGAVGEGQEQPARREPVSANSARGERRERRAGGQK